MSSGLDYDKDCIIDHNIINHSKAIVWDLPKYAYQEVLLEWNTNHVRGAKHHSISDLIINEMVEEVFTAWDKYQKRYKLWSYYTQWADSIFDGSFMMFTFSAHTRYNITPEFIDEYRKTMVSLIINDQYRARMTVFWLLYYQQTVDKELILSLVPLITYEYLQSILAQMKS